VLVVLGVVLVVLVVLVQCWCSAGAGAVLVVQVVLVQCWWWRSVARQKGVVCDGGVACVLAVCHEADPLASC